MSQLSPSQALTINEGYSFSRQHPIRLGIPVTRHLDNGKTSLARPPAVSTNPDRSCTYLVLRAHRMRRATSKTRLRVSPRWPHRRLGSDQHLEKHWPGGLNKDDPRVNYSQGKCYRLLGKCKTKVGPCWSILFKANYQGGPINHPTA